MSRKTLKTRTHILKSTCELLEASYGKSVRMSDVAKAAGLSRQAVYLHFPTRSKLLVAATQYLDEIKDVESLLIASRCASSGVERLDAFVKMWGNYIPEIYCVGKALMAIKDTDEAAATAWADRMQAVRHGCKAAVKALKDDGKLTPEYSVKQATDILWTLLSVRNWEQYRQECCWSQKAYIKTIQKIARDVLTI